jgi:hypothetical protein
MKRKQQPQSEDRSSVLENRDEFERSQADQKLGHMGDKPQKQWRDQGSPAEPSKE